MQKFYVFHTSKRGQEMREISRSAFFGWLSMMMQEETPYKDCGETYRTWLFNRVCFVMIDC